MKKYLLTGLALIAGACLLQWGLSTTDNDPTQELAMSTNGDETQSPALTTLKGEVMAINLFKRTTPEGKELSMVTLNVKTGENETTPLILGPASFVNDKIRNLQVGSQVSAEAFKPKWKKMTRAYVAKSLSFGDTTVSLRDDSLKPLWAEQKADSSATEPNNAPQPE